jgi:hypothetical protein
MYENARKKTKAKATPKTFNDKQKAAHAMSRAVFMRAEQIWRDVPGCDPYQALRTAWQEAKDKKIQPRFEPTPRQVARAKAKSNPFFSNPGEFVDPSSEYTVEQIAGKFHIIDSDGEPTGKYFLSEEKAYEKASKMNG